MNEYQDYIDSLTQQYGQWRPGTMEAMLFHESRGDPNVKDSPAGAKGLMQLMDIAVTDLGYDPNSVDYNDPFTNLRISAEYMNKLRTDYEVPEEHLALAYHAGPGNYRSGKVLNNPEGFPESWAYQNNVVGRIPPEIPPKLTELPGTPEYSSPMRVPDEPIIPEEAKKTMYGTWTPGEYEKEVKELADVQEAFNPVLESVFRHTLPGGLAWGAEGITMLTHAVSGLNKLYRMDTVGAMNNLGIAFHMAGFEPRTIEDRAFKQVSEFFGAMSDEQMDKAAEVWPEGKRPGYVNKIMSAPPKAGAKLLEIIGDTANETAKFFDQYDDTGAGVIDVPMGAAKAGANVIATVSPEVATAMKGLAHELGENVSQLAYAQFAFSMSDVLVPIGFPAIRRMTQSLGESMTLSQLRVIEKLGTPPATFAKKIPFPDAVPKALIGNEFAEVEALNALLGGKTVNATRREIAGEIEDYLTRTGDFDNFESIIASIMQFNEGALPDIKRTMGEVYNAIKVNPDIPPAVKTRATNVIKDAVASLFPEEILGLRSVDGLDDAEHIKQIIDNAPYPKSTDEASRLLDEYHAYGPEPQARARTAETDLKPGQDFNFKKARKKTGEMRSLERWLRHPFEQFQVYVNAHRANLEHASNKIARQLGGKGGSGEYAIGANMDAAAGDLSAQGVTGLGLSIRGPNGQQRYIAPSLRGVYDETIATARPYLDSDSALDRFFFDTEQFIVANRRLQNGRLKLGAHAGYVRAAERLKQIDDILSVERDAIKSAIGLGSETEGMAARLLYIEAHRPELSSAMKQVGRKIEKYRYATTPEDMLRHQKAANAYMTKYGDSDDLIRIAGEYQGYMNKIYEGILELFVDSNMINASDARILHESNDFFYQIRRLVTETTIPDDMLPVMGEIGGEQWLNPWTMSNKLSGESPAQNAALYIMQAQRSYNRHKTVQAFVKEWNSVPDALRKEYFGSLNFEFMETRPVGRPYVHTYQPGNKDLYITGDVHSMEQLMEEGFGPFATKLRYFAYEAAGGNVQKSGAMWRNFVTMSARFLLRNPIKDLSNKVVSGVDVIPGLDWLQSFSYYTRGKIQHADELHYKLLDGWLSRFENEANVFEEFNSVGASQSFVTSVDDTRKINPSFLRSADPSVHNQGPIERAKGVVEFSELMGRLGPYGRYAKARVSANRALGLDPETWYSRAFIYKIMEEQGAKSIPGVRGPTSALDKAIRPGKYPIRTDHADRAMGFGERYDYWRRGAGSYPDYGTMLDDIRNTNIDFNRFGKLQRAINAIIPFHNPALREPVVFAQRITDAPLTFAVRSARWHGSLSAYEQTTFGEDPDYLALPAWERVAFYYLSKNDETKEFTRIPVGHLGSMVQKFAFTSFFRHVFNLADEDPSMKPVREAYMQSAREIMGEATFIPGSAGFAEDSVPDGIKSGVLSAFASPYITGGLLEVTFNKDLYRGRSINPEEDYPDPVSYSQMYDEFTSPALVGLANDYPGFFDNTSMSPRDVEHLVESYGGNFGTAVINLADDLKGDKAAYNTIRWHKPKASNPLEVLADQAGGVGRSVFKRRVPAGRRTLQYDAFYKEQKRIMRGQKDVAIKSSRGEYEKAAVAIIKNPSIVSTDILSGMIDEAASIPPGQKKVLKARLNPSSTLSLLTEAKSKGKRRRTINLPTTIISDTLRLTGEMDRDIAANTEEYVGAAAGKRRKEQEPIYKEYERGEFDLRMQQREEYDGAVQRIRSGDWSQEFVYDLIKELGLDGIIRVLQKPEVTKGLMDSLRRRGVPEILRKRIKSAGAEQ